MKVDLIALLIEYGCSDKECIHEETITNSIVTFLQIRDFLIGSGEVFYEDTENNIYVASVRSGIFGMNRTIIALQIRGCLLFLYRLGRHRVFSLVLKCALYSLVQNQALKARLL